MRATETTDKEVVYWHKELPPLDVEPMGEHVVEALSARITNTIVHRDELWERCHDDLMCNARTRIEQEMKRLGGSCAHVLDESIDSRCDDRTGEAWLHGMFTYMLYRPTNRPNR